jgi:cellulose synthase/poly-beta-1,6-N-acetylglucosamine synthase-like glycosyltransferase
MKLKTFKTVGAGLIFLANLIPFLDLARHWSAVPRLSVKTARILGDRDALPRLSVIVPARNEEQGIRAALRSLLRQDYPGLELIAVNDRSTDRTGAILAELEREYPGRLRVLTVTELPKGWLGKNHALWKGAQVASGEWLLFTDADIVFDPACLRRAVTYAVREGLDHLTLSPRITAHGFWLSAFVDFFLYMFTTFQRPDLANNARSRVGMGVGAFNLIRRSAYEAIGTHQALSLRPDDDMRLGKRVKGQGLRQRVLNGSDLMSVEWYSSLGDAIRGLEKNAFAGLDYHVGAIAGSVAFMLASMVLPWVALWRARGWVRIFLAGTIAIQATTFITTNRMNRRSAVRYLPAFPVLALLFCYTVLRSTYLTLRQGGLYWRDTFYPLAELRAQSGLEGLTREPNAEVVPVKLP